MPDNNTGRLREVSDDICGRSNVTLPTAPGRAAHQDPISRRYAKRRGNIDSSIATVRGSRKCAVFVNGAPCQQTIMVEPIVGRS